MELVADVYNKVKQLSEIGDSYFEKRHFSVALRYYEDAISLLPGIKTEWEAATWLFVAVGDVHVNMGKWELALNAFQSALTSPNGISNAYIWFSLGQCFFHLGNNYKAKEHFMSAYMLDGADIFEGEDDQYFALIKGEL